ncbi:MAG: CoA transferase [Dehalococcoidia bacterium]|nr:CoA transferase [Dehalococcoidia bacterium]
MSTTQPNGSTPKALDHLRVVELGDMPAAYAANFLGGLGADVIKIEPPGGDPNRSLPPFAGETPDPERGIPFLNANLNKRSIVLDVNAPADQLTIKSLIDRADIVIEATPRGYLRSVGLDDDELRKLNPGLVTISITPFGQHGPYSDYLGGDAVAAAMSGLMMSQGDNERAPVVPPCQISFQIAGIESAYLALAAVRHRRQTGIGQRIDVSLQEALTFATVSAIPRYSQRSDIPTRPGPTGGAANIYRCKDGGHAALAIFMTGHWHVLTREWMEDPILSDPEWDNPQYRTDNQDLAQVLIGQHVEQFDRDEFVAECQKRGLACSPVNSFEDFVTSDHMRDRGWFQTINHPVVGAYQAPGAPVKLEKTPFSVSRPAPMLDQHREEIFSEIGSVPVKGVTTATDPSVSPDAAMLDGIRVADVTRAFAGPIGTMMLGFYGAEVVKVESASLEANREAFRPVFPDLNRNKLSCTVDLRSDGGKELFRQLVAVSDVVVDNFSAEIMRRLGLGWDDLRKFKPDIIQIGMPGMGSTGPLSRWVTYGNQLQAFSGLTLLWGHPESEMSAHAKGVVPDYVGAAFVAFSTAAAIEYRDRTGEGQFIEISQVDGQGAMMGPPILDYTINGNSWGSVGYDEPLTANLGPFSAYPCSHPDAWIVIACENDDQWAKLQAVMGGPTWAADPRFADLSGRRVNRDEVDHEIGEWTQAFTPQQALRLLQAGGVPAGIAMNGEQLFNDLHLRQRGHLVDVTEPPWGTLTHQGLPAIPEVSSASAAVRAPWLGDHNDYVFGDVLGMSSDDIKAQEESGAIR